MGREGHFGVKLGGEGEAYDASADKYDVSEMSKLPALFKWEPVGSAEGAGVGSCGPGKHGWAALLGCWLGWPRLPRN